MSKWLKYLLALNSLRKALGFGVFFEANKVNAHFEIVRKFNFQRVLVLAPHPDDDVFGCGGTLAQLSQNGAEITVAYFCDGAGGVPEGREEESEFGLKIRRDETLIEKRKEEARSAAKILGFKNQLFFGYPDGKLASGSASIKALEDLIGKTRPDIIFIPSFLDNHPDHRVTNEIFLNALKKFPEEEDLPEIWAYEIWTPIYLNRIVPINETIELKKKAIKFHQSQLQSRSYDKAILALNVYRAEISNVSGLAEGFFATTPNIYRKLYRIS